MTGSAKSNLPLLTLTSWVKGTGPFDCYIANTEAELDQGLCNCGSALQVRSNLRGFCVKQFSRKNHSQNPIAAELCQNIKHNHGLPTGPRYTPPTLVTKAVTKCPKSCLCRTHRVPTYPWYFPSSPSSRPVSDYYYKCLIYHIQAWGSPQPIHFLKAHHVSSPNTDENTNTKTKTVTKTMTKTKTQREWLKQ